MLAVVAAVNRSKSRCSSQIASRSNISSTLLKGRCTAPSVLSSIETNRENSSNNGYASFDNLPLNLKHYRPVGGEVSGVATHLRFSQALSVENCSPGFSLQQRRGFLNNLWPRRKQGDDEIDPLNTSKEGTDLNSGGTKENDAESSIFNDTDVSISQSGGEIVSSDTASQRGDDIIGSLEATLNNIEASTNIPTNTTTDTVTDALTALPFEPLWYKPTDQVINLLLYLHDVQGLPIAASVVTLTVVIRAILFPVMAKTQKNTSRMLHMRPELEFLKSQVDDEGKNFDLEQRQLHSKQMRALFRKYDCNPFKSLLFPLLQMPIFMSMFFGLQRLPNYFPAELSNGGMLWFTDLTVPDSTFILPLACAASFFLIIEMGKEQMLRQMHGEIIVNVFRGMALIIIPCTAYFPSILFMYWLPNNVISVAQTATLKQKSVRDFFGIWDPPKPVPGAPKPKGFMEQVGEAVEKVQGKGSASSNVTMYDDVADGEDQRISHKKKSPVAFRAKKIRHKR